LFRAGIYLNDLQKARRAPEDVAGYLELHIEQGGRLWKSDTRIGVVSGIVGRTTYTLTFLGEAAHSGTTALENRRDALHGAAALITEAHRWVRQVFPEGLFNAGNITTEPGAFNTIPSKAVLTVEVRHPEEQTLTRMEEQLVALAASVAERHNLKLVTRRAVHMPAAKMSDWAITTIEATCKRLDVGSYMRMVSYAGHDAQMISDFTPTGMIFVPSVEGVSHNPREFTAWDDVVLGTNVLLHTLIEMASRIQSGTPAR
jgi:N-carbamoyl-L-amino-acid hydrolase